MTSNGAKQQLLNATDELFTNAISIMPNDQSIHNANVVFTNTLTVQQGKSIRVDKEAIVYMYINLDILI